MPEGTVETAESAVDGPVLMLAAPVVDHCWTAGGCSVKAVYWPPAVAPPPPLLTIVTQPQSPGSICHWLPSWPGPLGVGRAKTTRVSAQPSRVNAAALPGSLFRDARDLDGQGRTLSNMGKTLAVTGQHAQAAERHQQALLFFQSAGNLLDYAYTQADLMAARFARADPEAAVFHGQQAADLLAELGHHASSGQVLADLAVVYRSAGDQARARACLRQSAVASAKASIAQREAALRLRTPLADPAKEPND